MDKENKDTLSFLARMVTRLINNDSICVHDMARLVRISEGTPFKNEKEERVIDFDKNTYVKVKLRGRIFDCYLGNLNQVMINTWQIHKPVYNTDLHLIAVDPQPIMMGDGGND